MLRIAFAEIVYMNAQPAARARTGGASGCPFRTVVQRH
jgi:hypothetical protein